MAARSPSQPSRVALVVLWVMLLGWLPAAHALVHPGLINNQAELNFIKTQVNNSQQPWLNYYNQIANYSTYTPKVTTPILDFGGAKAVGDVASGPLMQDCHAAYGSALQWVVTGVTARATKAIQILNHLAATVTGSTGTNAPLMWGWRIPPCIYAAEIMRYSYTGWASSEATAFQNWLVNVVNPRLRATSITGSANQGRTNHATLSARTRMAIGVFANNQTLFDQGYNDVRALIAFYIGSHTSGLPAGNGFTYETCRHNGSGHGTLEGADLAHTQLGLSGLVIGAEIAKKQGLNLYGYLDPADGAGILKAMQYHDQWIGFLEGRSGSTAAGWPCQTPITDQNTPEGTRDLELWVMAANHYDDPGLNALRNYVGNRCGQITNRGAECFGLTHRYGTSAPADTEDPSIPGSPAAVANSSSQITLTWTASTDNVGVTGYEISHCTTAGCTPTAQLAIDPASPFAHTGLAPSSLHRYRIRAQDAAGNESAQTATVEATTDASNPVDTTPPSTPGSAAAVATSSTEITLTWTASTDNLSVTGYRIDHCTTAGCTPTTQLVIDAGSPFVHQNLTPLSLHRYRIRARDEAGNLSTATATVEATTPDQPLVDTTPPTVPGSPAAVADSSTQITLTWAAATDNVGVTSYRIDHCTTPGCAPSQKLVDDPSSPFVHQNLAAESLHRYRIRAQDAAGNLSGATVTVEATTQEAPPSPGTGNLYYVSTTGNNTNPGTLAQPFLTIGKAFSTMAPGDTTYVRGGLYMMNNVSLPVGTSTVLSKDHTQWTKPITLRSYPGEIAEFQQIITSPKTGCTWSSDDTKPYTKHFVRIIGEDRPDTFDPTDSSGGKSLIFNICAIHGRGQYIWLENLELKNGPGTQVLAVGMYSTLKNLNCHHNGGTSTLAHCLYAKPNHLTVDGGMYHHNAAYGLHIFRAQSTTNFCTENWNDLEEDECGLKFVVVKNTTTFANGTGGIILSWGNGPTLGGQNEVYNNVSYDHGVSGITVRTPNSLVANNTLYNNKMTAATIGSQMRITGENIRVMNNVIWGSGWPALHANNSPHPTTILHNNVLMKKAPPCQVIPDDPTPCVHYDPQVVNLAGRDFRLKSVSPLINAGVNLAGVPKTDFSGALRVGVPDIGAWEFGAAAPCTKPGGDCTAPSVPLNLTATLVSPTHVALDWADSTGSPTLYRIYRCESLAGCTPTTIIETSAVSTFADTSVVANTPYTWAVSAGDAAGNFSEQSSPVSLTTTAPGPDTTAPTVPTGLSFGAVAFDQINGTWTSSTDAVGVTGYRVRRCDATAVPGCTPATQVGTTNTPSFSSPNLSAATAYRFTVAAEDAAGNVSAYSSVASATTPAAPATPETVLLLNNDVQDSSGQGHHGTSTGVTFDATNTREGSHAALFDATTDRLTVPMTAFSTPNQLTIAVNVRPTSFGGAFQYIIGHTTLPYFANRIQLCVNTTGMLGVGLGSSAGCGLNPSVMQLALNTWYHLVLRLNNGTYTIDVDAVRKASGTYTGLTTLASTLTLGNNQGPNTQGWIGQMDGLRVVGRVWSDAEVDADCDLYVPGGCGGTLPSPFDPFVMLTGVQGDGANAINNERLIVTMQGVPNPTACQNLADFFVAYAQAREPVITCTLSGSTLTLGVANPPETPHITLALTYQPTAQQIPLTNQTVADPAVGTDLQQASWWCRPDGPTDDEPWIGLPNTLCRVPSPGVLNLRVDVVNVGAVPSPEQTYKLFCDREVGDQVLAQRITEVFPSPIGIFLNTRTEGVVPDGTPRTPVLPAIAGITAVTAGTMERDDQSSISPVLAPQTRTEYEFSLAFMADIPRGTVFSCGLRAGDAGIPLSQTNLATIRIDHARWVVR